VGEVDPPLPHLRYKNIAKPILRLISIFLKKVQNEKNNN